MKGYIPFFKANIARELSNKSPNQADYNKHNPYYNKDFSELRQAFGTSRLK